MQKKTIIKWEMTVFGGVYYPYRILLCYYASLFEWVFILFVCASLYKSNK